MYERTQVRGLLLAIVVGSGCLGGPDGSESSAILVNAEYGGVAGHVVTDDLYPLQSARASIFAESPLDLMETQIVDEGGGFGFFGLAPGEYAVLVENEGFFTENLTVEVAAGSVLDLNIVLRAVPARTPYYDVVPWTGFHPCGFSFVLTPANICPAPLNATARVTRIWDIQDGFRAIVAETTWLGSNQDASSWFYNYTQEQKQANQTGAQTATASILDYAWGGRPLRVELVAGVRKPNVTGLVSNQYAPVSDGGFFRMRETMFWNGYYGELFSPLNPACQQLTYPRCAGVGAIIDFKFTTWLTVFMVEMPAELRAYSALPDS